MQQVQSASLSPSCHFCGSSSVVRTYQGLFHKTKLDHGPFDIYRCSICGSIVTFPLPSEESLRRLYESFAGGLQPRIRQLRDEEPLSKWNERWLERVQMRSGRKREERFEWVEVGAGDGSFALRMAHAFPRSSGVAVDWHPVPEALAGHDRVAWRERDLNRPGFAQQLSVQADMVLSLAVWEHVLRPDLFVRNLLAMLRPGGMLYLMSPNYGSAMRFLMRRHWPYFLPGEHLNVATCKGARACLERMRQNALHAQQTVFASPVSAYYPLRYVLKYLRLGPVARLLPHVSLPLPVGILEAGIKPASRSRG